VASKRDFNKNLSPIEVMDFIEKFKAVSILETKIHFDTGSESVRRALAKLWYHNKILLIPYRRTVYAIQNTHQRGAPNVTKLWAEGHGKSKAESSKRKTTEKTPEEREEFLKQLREEAAEEKAKRKQRMKDFEEGRFHPGDR
jgi:hypothetical protein